MSTAEPHPSAPETTDADAEWLENGVDRGGTLYVALRDSRCQGLVPDGADEKRPCPFQARYFMVRPSDWEVVGLCGHHVNDHWTAALAGEAEVDFEVYDAHDRACAKALESRESKPDEPVPRCGDRAAVLLRASNGQDYRRAYCRRHALDPWLEILDHGGEQ